MTNSALFIDQALGLAAQALFLSSPAPRAGCVLVGSDGTVIGQGFTQRGGQAQAEVVALREAVSNARNTAGATAYTTMEPCSQNGPLATSCDALIQAGIAKVVASIANPDPLVAGRGFARLRAAGIEVSVGEGAQASRELNIGYFSRMVRGTPWVRVKTAASLDGTTALSNGASQWITSREARADGHAWRARACAVLTGLGTVLDDDPQLDVRDVPTQRQPDVVVVDSRLQIPLNARLLRPARSCYIYTCTGDPYKQSELTASDAVHVIRMPNDAGKVDLGAMLQDLGRRGINEVHVEAGHQLTGSLVREQLVDEWLVYLAPRLLGKGFGMADFGPLTGLSDGVSLDFKSVDRIGADLRILARVEGRDCF